MGGVEMSKNQKKIIIISVGLNLCLLGIIMFKYINESTTRETKSAVGYDTENQILSVDDFVKQKQFEQLTKFYNEASILEKAEFQKSYEGMLKKQTKFVEYAKKSKRTDAEIYAGKLVIEANCLSSLLVKERY